MNYQKKSQSKNSRDLLLEYMKKSTQGWLGRVFWGRIGWNQSHRGYQVWNLGLEPDKSPEFNVRRDTKFTSGKVEVFANVVESKSRTQIYGDFFGIEDVAAVEDVLRGVKPRTKMFLKP